MNTQKKITDLRLQLYTPLPADNSTLGTIIINAKNPVKILEGLIQLKKSGRLRVGDITLLYRSICRCNPDMLEQSLENPEDPKKAIKRLEEFHQKSN